MTHLKQNKSDYINKTLFIQHNVTTSNRPKCGHFRVYVQIQGGLKELIDLSNG